MKVLKNNKFLKILYGLLKFSITLVIIGLIIIIVVQRISNNKVSVAGFRLFNVATESMVPKYLVGDILIVKTVNVDDIKIGDDVTYQGEVGDFTGKIITHQLIDIETAEDGTKIYHTKGIANDIADPTITANQIYGIVIAKLAFLTYISGIINNMWVMYAILIVAVGLVMFLDIRDLRKDEKEELSEIEVKNDKKEKPKKRINKMREKRRKRQKRNKT